jgi:hypothetical protein
MAPSYLLGGKLYVVDAANGFDPYAFSGEARRRGVREGVLDRVLVSRCFTIHQLAAVVEELVVAAVREDREAVVGVLGMDHLFLEESLRAAERGRVLRRVMDRLEGLRRGGVRLFVTHEAVPPGEPLWRPLRLFGDVRLRVRPGGNEQWKLSMERCPDGTNLADFQYLVAGGDGLLEGLPPGSAGGATGGV